MLKSGTVRQQAWQMHSAPVGTQGNLGIIDITKRRENSLNLSFKEHL